MWVPIYRQPIKTFRSRILKYYLRLLSSPQLFLEVYSRTLELDFQQKADIKETHLRYWKALLNPSYSNSEPSEFRIQKGFIYCKNPTFGLDEKIIYPPRHAAPPANNNLPYSVKFVYDETSAIANQSPRAACAC